LIALGITAPKIIQQIANFPESAIRNRIRGIMIILKLSVRESAVYISNNLSQMFRPTRNMKILKNIQKKRKAVIGLVSNNIRLCINRMIGKYNKLKKKKRVIKGKSYIPIEYNDIINIL